MFNKTTSLLKRSLFLLLLLLLLGQISTVQAQTTASTIENMAVDIWPDYDRPSVLVIFTGVLPADVSLPAIITIPMPDNADLNAVARITAENDLIDDIAFDENEQGVTLTTPEPRFRVEYYMPYDLTDDERTFTFEWLADITVAEMRLSVQQPVGTTEMTTAPAVFSVTPREDGFQYHNLSPQPVATGERLSLAVTYRRPMSQLSAELLQPRTPNQPATNQPETAPGTRLDLPTILLASGGVAILAVGAWMLVGERMMAARQKRTKPRRKAKTAQPKNPEPEVEVEVETAEPPSHSFVRFCHQCGQKSDPGDRFCRSCGTRLKKTT